MDVIGTISSVISLVQITVQTLSHLKHVNTINEDVKERLAKLHGRSCKFQANFRSIKDKFVNERSTLPKEKCEQVKLQVDVVSELIEEVNSALDNVKTTVTPSSSNNALRRAWWRTKLTVKTAFSISSITERLDTVNSKLQEAISVTSRIMSLIDLEEIKELSNNVEGGASSSKGGVFYSHFDRP
eukprot:IDg22493t1